MAPGLITALPCWSVPFDAGGIQLFAAAIAVGEVGGAVRRDLFSCNSFFEELKLLFFLLMLAVSSELQIYLFHFKIKHHQKLITPPPSL